MKAGEIFGAIASLAVRRARLVLVLSALLAIAAAVVATRLDTDAGTDTLVDADDPTFQATEEFHRKFGDDAIVVLVEGDLRRLVLTRNLGKLLRLEGCLGGRPPQGVKPLPGPCAELARTRPARVVYGPATFLNQAVLGIRQAFEEQVRGTQAEALAAARAAAREAARRGESPAEQRLAAQAAAEQVSQQFQQRLLQIAAQYGLTSLPRIDDPRFVSQIVFDTRQPPGTPKARFAYLFPNDHSALISVRLRPDLSDAERHDAIELIERAVNETRPREVCAIRDRPAPCFALDGGRYVLSGVPVVVDALAGILKDSLLVLLVAALVAMAITLGVVFRSRLPLLPLALALGAAALTFGLLGLTGGALTMASIAVLPVLIGLAVDYAIQLQARFDEARAAGASGPEAARVAASNGGPVVGAAFLATGAGFLALLVSPVPMVRSFGLLLVLGIGIAFLGSLTVGFAALSLGARSSADPSPEAPRVRRRLRLPAFVGTATAAVGRWRDRAGSAIARFGKNALAVAITSPGRVLAVAAALAACGWAAGTQTEVVSDIERLVPRDLGAIRDVNELQDETGVSGELDVIVRAPDITDPQVITWMGDFKDRVLERHGFRGEFPSCEKAELCPGTSLPDLFTNPATELTRGRVRALLEAIPAYDSQAVVTRDPETGELGHTANVAFGIRVMPLDEQKRLIDDIRAQIDPPGPGNGPPAGVRVSLAGLPVLAAESNADLSGSRYWLTLAGLLCVALALLAVYRSFSRALVPLVPIVLATGWSALVVAAMDIPLNPMSAALGALVIAIATEFSVILAARYQQERGVGHSVGEALRRCYARTGAAVLASGITAIVGFAALIASDIRMLRDFGLVTVVDLGVALTGVMLVLPAVLVLAEKGFAARRLPLVRRGRPAPARMR